MEQQPGYKTTEFWLTTITAIAAPVIALLVTRGYIPSEEQSLWLDLVNAAAMPIALLVSSIVVATYTNSRKSIKEAQVNIRGIQMTTQFEDKE